MKIAEEYGAVDSPTNAWIGSDVVQSIRNYIDYLHTSKRIEAQTAEGYEYSLKHIARGFEGISVTEVTPSHIMSWLMKSFEEGHSANVMKRAMRLLSQYYNRLIDSVPFASPALGHCVR